MTTAAEDWVLTDQAGYNLCLSGCAPKRRWRNAQLCTPLLRRCGSEVIRRDVFINRDLTPAAALAAFRLREQRIQREANKDRGANKVGGSNEVQLVGDDRTAAALTSYSSTMILSASANVFLSLRSEARNIRYLIRSCLLRLFRRLQHPVLQPIYIEMIVLILAMWTITRNR